MTTTHTTFCRICIAACGMEVTVEDNRVVGIRGDASHPLTRGYLCPKGRALGDVHHAPGRLEGALVGRGEARRAVDIDEAHADLRDRLGEVVRAHGTGAVGVFHGTGGFQDALGSWAVRKLKGALGGGHSYSTATVDAIAKTLVAERMAGTPLLIPNVDETQGRLLVLIGINPVVSHGHATMFSNPVERLRAARRRGPVFVLDPRATESARLADHHLAVRPGTDYAVLAYVIRTLLARGAVDLEALAARATGLDGLQAAVAPFDADAVTARSGVPAVQLDALVDAVVDAGRLAILSGTGSSMSAPANLTEWMAWALLVLTDSFDEPGGMWFNPGAFTRLERLAQLPPAAATEPRPPSRPDVERCAGEWPAALIPDEIEAGRLRALIVVGGNLITALPDPQRLAAALSAIDVLVVLEIQRSATTDLATHVFACADQLERPDILPLELNANVVYQHYTDAVVEAGPGRAPMWQTLCRIGHGIGLDTIGGGRDPAEVSTEEMLDRQLRGTTLAEWRAAGDLQVEAPVRYGWVRDRLPFGRWELAPAALVAQLRDVADPPPLVLVPRRPTKRMNWQHYRAGERHEALVHPDDASAAGIADGDLIEVRSATGSLRIPVRVTDVIVAGAVSIQHGWPDANVNALIDRHALDPLSGMVRLSGTPVTIAAVTPA